MFRLRAILYVVVMTAAVAPWSFVVLAAWVMPPTTRYRLCTMWTRLAIRMARLICGVTWRVEGWDNLPDGPAIVLAKHQSTSTWETLWLPSFLPRRLSFVYKRELHWLPFFGWGLASLGMINIDRSRGQDAFEQVVTQGEEHLRDGWWIVIFPEGTRTAPGSTRRYKTGGARLAVRTGVPVLPIAVNSGEVWPRSLFIKRPGEVTVSIGPPIETRGKTADQVAAEVEQWIETEMRRLAPHRYSAPYPQANGTQATGAQATSRVG
ncbi:MAG: 1-acyl-sn-glycerol-3-phosphate acyltransferase [Burkholderiaceae bacterium]|nr:1-acyl-sn-glycerol-3-phosphate acyltransferase [Burkholderiaceae bacterium]